MGTRRPATGLFRRRMNLFACWNVSLMWVVPQAPTDPQTGREPCFPRAGLSLFETASALLPDHEDGGLAARSAFKCAAILVSFDVV